MVSVTVTANGCEVLGYLTPLALDLFGMIGHPELLLDHAKLYIVGSALIVLGSTAKVDEGFKIGTVVRAEMRVLVRVEQMVKRFRT